MLNLWASSRLCPFLWTLSYLPSGEGTPWPTARREESQLVRNQEVTTCIAIPSRTF